MNVPLLKLHIDASGKQMNQKNMVLSAEEQFNLKINNLEVNGAKEEEDASKDLHVFSLEDLFNLNLEDKKDNIYQVICKVE